jgi:hypothetical protein
MTSRSHLAKKRRNHRMPSEDTTDAVGLYHNMYVEENFERCAYRLFEIVKCTVQRYPGKKRILHFDVEGHRNDLGGFDHDAWEILNHFILEFLGPYLTEIATPLLRAQNPKPQREDVPNELIIRPAPDGNHVYDVSTLNSRSREFDSATRNSPPSLKVIADYLGMAEPRCLICSQTPVERAHALPRSLGGSYDVHNFALLCPRHHKLAPDVSDVEAFWTWIDYMCLCESQIRRANAHGGLSGKSDIHAPSSGPAKERMNFINMVRRELVELYGWQDSDSL